MFFSHQNKADMLLNSLISTEFRFYYIKRQNEDNNRRDREKKLRDKLMHKT